MISKSYLAPKDETSISRLELLAAVTAVKLDMFISTELQMNLKRSTFSPDSSVVESEEGFEFWPPFGDQKCRIVLITDESTSRSHWSLGRIVSVYLDDQEIVRTVSIKTRDTEVKRPTLKICLIIRKILFDN